MASVTQTITVTCASPAELLQALAYFEGRVQEPGDVRAVSVGTGKSALVLTVTAAVSTWTPPTGS